MRPEEKAELDRRVTELRSISIQARAVLFGHAQARAEVTSAIEYFQRARVSIFIGRGAWKVIPLAISDGERLAAIARFGNAPALDEATAAGLAILAHEMEPALLEAEGLSAHRRFFVNKAKRHHEEEVVALVDRYADWVAAQPLSDVFRSHSIVVEKPASVPLAGVLDPHVWFDRAVARSGGFIADYPARRLSKLPGALADIRKHQKSIDAIKDGAIRAGVHIRTNSAAAIVEKMPVDRLREATRERISVAPLESSGIRTVADVLRREKELTSLPGVGEVTARRIAGAARTLWQTTYEETPVRIDVRARARSTTELLRHLQAWDRARKNEVSAQDVRLAQDLDRLGSVINRGAQHLVVVGASTSPPEALLEQVDSIIGAAESIVSSRALGLDPWKDFQSRPADYFAMLDNLGILTEGELKAHGDLPAHIIKAVRELELRGEYIVGSLRGYQGFAARFALVQRKVLIGDEMGLGKTFEAIAALAHLRALGEHHFLVVCPAAVVTNWMREIRQKSKIVPHRLHGPGRAEAARMWLRNGGVAVTTFESLEWLASIETPPVASVVVDEAQYVKNPRARRSLRTAALIEASRRAILLTGTPLENRIDEFANLIGYLRPDLIVARDGLSAGQFRKQVAPAYLRRNQEDVLTELPELVEVPENIAMSREDLLAYRSAVSDGNFMAMRQAAMLNGRRSAKMERIVDLVEEAKQNDRRVIVFSHFRQVLENVVRELPGRVFGPLTGSVPAFQRQRLVDDFSRANHGAVLAAQSLAGGVGLNIQAASVVIICEPQLKPTTEWQAIARARRMGQLDVVQVHRLLSDEGVDQRIADILATKSRIFEDFARVSNTAASAPEAFDVSEAELARRVVAEERQRVFGQRAAGETSTRVL